MTENNKSVSFNPVIAALPETIPFVAPEELERNQGRPFLARLGANESAFGISLAAREALFDAITTTGCSWYGDPLSHDLRTELGRQLEVNMDNLVVDGGIDTLLGLTVRLFMQPGDTLVTSAGAYPTVNYHAVGVGAKIAAVPYRDNHEDTVALAEAAHRHKARMVYLANPDNPMGTQVSRNAVTRLIDDLPGNCMLLLDEAYVEFMTSADLLPLDTKLENVVRFRTFSKAYGMAGMRIGYAIGSNRVVRGYDKIRNHFGVNRLAQVAALASLKDPEILTRVLAEVERGRQRLYELAASLQLPCLPSATNFVAVDLGDGARATELLTKLSVRGIFMRKPMQAPLDRYLRMGVGTSKEHAFLCEVLPELVRER